VVIENTSISEEIANNWRGRTQCHTWWRQERKISYMEKEYRFEGGDTDEIER
jgi:hypothetical protein